jgi:triacylglycerol lipase
MDKNRAFEMAQLSERAYLPLKEFQKLHTDRRFSFHSVFYNQFYTVWTATELIFIFRGTEITDFSDIKADLKMRLTPVTSDNEAGKVHRGFKKSLDMVWDALMEDYNRLCEGRTVICTGHSLGAAMATLAFSRLDMFENAELYTFGSPRVGNSDYAAVLNFKHGERIFRFINNSDIVCRHPMAFWNYRHVGIAFYFNSDGTCTTNPSFWHRLKQFGSGMFEGFLDKKIDSLADHSVSNYVRLTKELDK